MTDTMDDFEKWYAKDAHEAFISDPCTPKEFAWRTWQAARNARQVVTDEAVARGLQAFHDSASQLLRVIPICIKSDTSKTIMRAALEAALGAKQ